MVTYLKIAHNKLSRIKVESGLVIRNACENLFFLGKTLYTGEGVVRIL